MSSESTSSFPVATVTEQPLHLDLGSELRKIRESKKLSVSSVATAVGVSPSLLSQVETGKTQPSVSTLYALVNHSGVSLDGLPGQHRPTAVEQKHGERWEMYSS